tara:strand:+ start:25520 stop:25984 length:465 start_codon:yes stop_codon:yes gene_type:complete
MKPRHPKKFSSAITKIRTALGEDACAQIVDRSTSLVRKWADPDHPTFPSIDLAVLLDEAYVREGHGAPPILELYTKQLAEGLEEDEVESVDILMSALTVQGIVGDLSEAIREALDPKGAGGQAVSPRERMKILELLEKLDAEADSIEDAIEVDC